VPSELLAFRKLRIDADHVFFRKMLMHCVQ